jgi:hypothetical protein
MPVTIVSGSSMRRSHTEQVMTIIAGSTGTRG